MEERSERMTRIVCLVVLVSLCCLLVMPAMAADETTIMMEEIVVTATRDAEEIQRIPASVTVITADDIEKTGAESVVDLLETLEGITFRSFSGNPSQASIDLRGFGDYGFARTLVMLDGRRLNRPDMMSVNWLQIPIRNVERIEVVRGAGSVLYGDAAIAGLINIITKRGEGKPEVNTSATVGSYGLHDEGFGISGSEGRLSYTFIGQNQGMSGYRDRSKFRSRSAAMNLDFDATDSVTLSGGVSCNRTNYEMPGYLSKEEMESDRKQAGNPDDDATNDYVNVDFQIASILGDVGEFDLALLYGRKEIDSNFTSWSTYAKWNIDTLGISPKYIVDRKILGRDNKLLAGLDYYDEGLDRDGFSDREKYEKTISAELERQSVGLYLRDEFNVFENLILTAGYRTERSKVRGRHTTLATMTVDFDDEKIHRGEAYEAGLTLLFGKKSRAFAKYAKVYRYPLLDEQASYQGWGPLFLADLDAEVGRSCEVGADIRPSENLKVGVTVYSIEMEDEIAYNPATYRNENLDDTRHRGVEVALSYLFADSFKVYGNLTFQDAEFSKGENSGSEIPLVPTKMASGGVELSLPGGFLVRPEVRYVGSSYLGSDYDNSAEKLEAFTLWNLSLHYGQEFDSVEFKAFLGIENITDEKYSTLGYEGIAGWTPDSYYPQPGITVKGGVAFTF
jgi:iron complex outermembrane receptor protein